MTDKAPAGPGGKNAKGHPKEVTMSAQLQTLHLLPRYLVGSIKHPVSPHTLRRGVRMGLLAFVALIFLSVLAIAAYGTRGAMSRVFVAGVVVKRGISVEELQKQIEASVKDYRLTLRYEDGQTKSFEPKEAGIEIDTLATAQSARTYRDQESYLHRLQWWYQANFPLTLKVNSQQLNSFIATHATRANVPAKNAGLGISNGEIVVEPEVAGSGYQIAEAPQRLINTVGTLDTQPLPLEPGNIMAAISKKKIEPIKKKLEAILAQPISFVINGKTITASRADIGAWVELTPVESAQTIDLTINSGKVLEYLNTISKPYVSLPRNQVVLTGSEGNEIILVRGRNGTDVENKDAIASAVAKKALEAQGAQAELPVRYSPFKTVAAQDYEKWLIVDTASKRMYAYAGRDIVRTFLISSGAPATPTVKGHFKIFSKVRIQDMRGFNVDGSRYFQPDVEWVSYFYKDYAIHGNYWRPLSWFGAVNSSHGCVGIVNGDAEWVYNWATIGTPVIVYQ